MVCDLCFNNSNALWRSSFFLPDLLRPAKPNNICSSDTRKVMSIFCNRNQRKNNKNKKGKTNNFGLLVLPSIACIRNPQNSVSNTTTYLLKFLQNKQPAEFSAFTKFLIHLFFTFIHTIRKYPQSNQRTLQTSKIQIVTTFNCFIHVITTILHKTNEQCQI